LERSQQKAGIPVFTSLRELIVEPLIGLRVVDFTYPHTNNKIIVSFSVGLN